MKNVRPKVSVIIATLNRGRALREIALNSLSDQTYENFEVIVWDASDDDDTAQAVSEFRRSHVGIDLRYFRAPRRGSSSQRNDAANEAVGDIFFFIDDDTRLSPDGLEKAMEEFENEDVAGVGLPFHSSGKKKRRLVDLSILFDVLFCRPRRGERRRVFLSGAHTWPREDEPGAVQWLSGGCVAYRASLFRKYRFPEQLQRFGGYALGEDLFFSHRLLQEGEGVIVIARGGYYEHFPASGGRLNEPRLVAASIYNRYVVWKEVIYPHNRWSAALYLWSLLGDVLYYCYKGILKPSRIYGMLLGLKEIIVSRESVSASDRLPG